MGNGLRHSIESGNHRGILYGISHNGLGYRCGYIFLERGHPWFGMGTEALNHDGDPCYTCGTPRPRGPLYHTCHGGVTFANEEEEMYIIGFDCGHAGDAPDPELDPKAHAPFACSWEPGGFEVIRSTDYVREICFRMCELAAEARAALAGPKAFARTYADTLGEPSELRRVPAPPTPKSAQVILEEGDPPEEYLRWLGVLRKDLYILLGIAVLSILFVLAVLLHQN